MEAVMRIDPNNKIENIYDTRLHNVSKKEESAAGELSRDRVELSGSAAKKDESAVSAMKNQIVSEVERGASPDKLRRLRSEIQNGTYQRDASDIAEIMLWA
jgi:anti-sigma28 factor (negative regulator of flagellin synthesis)